MSSEQDDVIVMVDHQEAVVSISVPGVDETIRIPTAWCRTRTKVDDAGVAHVTVKIRADEFHVRPAEPTEVVIRDLPAPVTPEQAFEAQMAEIQERAGHRR